MMPPVPFRYKVTKGAMISASWDGQPSATEVVNPMFYWGVKFERNTSPMNPNPNTEKNELLENLTKFVGIRKLDVLVTGSGADTFNNNKFSLSKVVLSNTSLTQLTASISTHQALLLRLCRITTLCQYSKPHKT
jgi:hypothetical protein